MEVFFKFPCLEIFGKIIDFIVFWENTQQIVTHTEVFPFNLLNGGVAHPKKHCSVKF